jgi:hypothetical protein
LGASRKVYNADAPSTPNGSIKHMPLNDRTCKTAKPRDTTYRISDGLGLYLEVMPNGSKYRRCKYRFAGKEKRLAFGVYPAVGLKDARDKRDAARRQIANGVDPGAAKRAAKIAQAGAESFEAIAREWLEQTQAKRVSTTNDTSKPGLRWICCRGSASARFRISLRRNCLLPFAVWKRAGR